MDLNQRKPVLIGVISLVVFVVLNTIALQNWHIPGGIKDANAASICRRGSFHCGNTVDNWACRVSPHPWSVACRPCNMCVNP